MSAQKDSEYQDRLREHIINSIGDAVEKGWIKAWYQPVIRTMTGEICGMEALARWDDPEFGLLLPADFVPVLEKAGLVHLMDSCMINSICSDYEKYQKDKTDSVTVSFNLSRLDFSLCDIHQVIDDAIRSRRLPRDAFRVEITESMIENNEKPMHEAMDRFWDYGLRVWMDDFGSGFSSLNVLKDYNFDTIKIDMAFMRDLNIRSKEIIRSIVDMSKRIGVHTLAEGVESEEQLSFLKSIGCEKAQGYHIGRPLPFGECMEELRKKGLKTESRSKQQYYNEIGSVNILSPDPIPAADQAKEDMPGPGQAPVAIVEVSDKKLRYLFANDDYMKILERVGIGSLEAVENEYNSASNASGKRFRMMLQKAEQTADTVSADFVQNGSHFFSRAKKIAGYPGGSAFLCEISYLPSGDITEKDEEMTAHGNDLFSMYEEIELIDLNTGYSRNIYMATQNRNDYNRKPVKEEILDFAREQIYPEDRERFIEFMDLDTIEERLDNSSTPFISSPFRILGPDGQYLWKLSLTLYAGDKKNRRILSCNRMIDSRNVQIFNEGSIKPEIERAKASSLGDAGKDTVLPPELLWNNLVNNSAYMFFWKDRDRRFAGVSRAFLDYYGIESEADIIGKNDEEMGWHVNPVPYKSDEEAVLEDGLKISSAPGKCLCNGEIRDIEASKMPVYDDGGEIVGIIGSFNDVTSKKKSQASLATTTDSQTGMLNFLGIIDSAMHYQESYVTQNTDFAIVFLSIENYQYYCDSYGLDWGNSLLRTVGQVLKFTVGVMGVVGRYSSDNFMILTQCPNENDIPRMLERVEDRVSKIEVVDGIPCTVYFKKGFARYSEVQSIQALYNLAEERAKS